MGPAGPVDQTCLSLVLVATPPLVCSWAGHPHLIRHVGHREASLDPPAQAQSALWGERGVTVHTSLRSEWDAVNSTTLASEAHPRGDPPSVNNLCGQYN